MYRAPTGEIGRRRGLWGFSGWWLGVLL